MERCKSALAFKTGPRAGDVLNMAPEADPVLREQRPEQAAPRLIQEAQIPEVEELPWFVLPLAGPFGFLVVATMTWLNLQSM